MLRITAMLSLALAAGCKTNLSLPDRGEVIHSLRGQAPSPPAIVPVSGESLRYTQVKVAATIGHEAVITDDEVWQMVRSRMREFADLIGEERAAKEKQIYREELKELVGRELLVLELFERMRKNKVEERIEDLKKHATESAERDILDRKKRQGFGHLNEEDFVKLLTSQGLNMAMLKRQLEQETLSRIYLEQTLKDKIKYISFNDLWDYYQSNPKDFEVQDRAKWLDLFVSFRNFNTVEEARAHATAAWKSAMAGADFAELVKKYGQGDSNLRDGEGIGQKRGEIQPAELEPIIMELNAGQVSPLLQTATGYHIVKVVEREKAGTLPFDERVQSLIRMKLTMQVQEHERQKAIEELWRKHRPMIVEPD